jgi:hypothetical protein
MKIIVKKCRLHGIIKSLDFNYSSFLYRFVLRVFNLKEVLEQGAYL